MLLLPTGHRPTSIQTANRVYWGTTSQLLI
uniref:Uncharacterized protein n=1 Tax=Anguilla anguilla TaxID=7936 RepID=A0A0E9UZ36_ANGAN